MKSSNSHAPRPALPALGLGWRLFAAMGLVVLAGAGTMLVAVLLVAEPAFDTHLSQVQPPMSDQAHRTADGAGSGIGLTIAKAIVQAHHGQLLGHSAGPGEGARFEITLPIADAGNHAPQP